MNTAVALVPWLLMFVYMALWLQASSHKRQAWKRTEDAWREVLAVQERVRHAQDQTQAALDVNKRLMGVIDRYEEITRDVAAVYGSKSSTLVDAVSDHSQSATVAERDKQHTNDLGRVTP